MLKKEKKPPTPEQIALGKRVNEAILSLGKGGKNDVAAACGITPQSVTGWCKTGRISTDSLLVVEKMTGRSLAWLLTGKDTDQNQNTIEGTAPNGKPESHADLSTLMAVSSPKTQQLLAMIQQAERENRLTEDDIKLLQTITKRLADDKTGTDR